MKKVAIVMGGDSSERVISLKSAEIVYQELSKSNFEVYKIDIDGSKWTGFIDDKSYEIDKNDFSLNGIHFDAVFVAIHGTPGENGLLQAYFEMLNIPHTTCNTFEAALTFNKARCNALLRAWNIPVARSILLNKGKDLDETLALEHLSLPMFVKPNRAGSSFGISRVNRPSQLKAAIAKAREHDDEVLIESFLEGREVTCGVHDLEGKPLALPVTEIITDHEFFDYQAKYEGASEEITPAALSEDEKNIVQGTAVQVYELLNLKGVCRIDFKLFNGKAYVIEVNTVPGLSAASIIPQQVIAAGGNMTEFYSKMVLQAR